MSVFEKFGPVTTYNVYLFNSGKLVGVSVDGGYVQPGYVPGRFNELFLEDFTIFWKKGIQQVDAAQIIKNGKLYAVVKARMLADGKSNIQIKSDVEVTRFKFPDWEKEIVDRGDVYVMKTDLVDFNNAEGWKIMAYDAYGQPSAKLTPGADSTIIQNPREGIAVEFGSWHLSPITEDGHGIPNTVRIEVSHNDQLFASVVLDPIDHDLARRADGKPRVFHLQVEEKFLVK